MPPCRIDVKLHIISSIIYDKNFMLKRIIYVRWTIPSAGVIFAIEMERIGGLWFLRGIFVCIRVLSVQKLKSTRLLAHI